MKYLILPVAGESSRYPNMRPKWLLTMPDGLLMIEKSVSKINCKKFDKVFVIANKKHLDNFVNRKLLLTSLKKNISKKLELIELTKKTSCSAETVVNFLKKKKLNGSILIKDCDGEFSVNTKHISKKNLENSVYAVDINNIDLIDAKNKSYIEVDKFNVITNIVEKKIISNLFCCGAYAFRCSNEFMNNAKDLLKLSKNVYISHVILKMILSGAFFKYYQASEYIDWGTVREFRNWQRKHFTIFCDFDGCLVDNGSKFGLKGWRTKAIKKNIESLNSLSKNNNIYLIITTSRPYSELFYVKKILNKNNIKYNNIIMNLPHGRRILVNDFSNTNPYPSALAIKIERNSQELSNIFSNIV